MSYTGGMSHIYAATTIVAKTGYRVLYNGDIVGLDDEGNPTSEPFEGYISDEHRLLAEELKAEDEIERRLRPPRVLKSGKWPQQRQAQRFIDRIRRECP